MQNFDAFVVLLVVLGKFENCVVLQPNFCLPRQNDIAQSEIKRTVIGVETNYHIKINAFHSYS